MSLQGARDHSVVLPGLNRGLYLVPKVSFRAKKSGWVRGRAPARRGGHSLRNLNSGVSERLKPLFTPASGARTILGASSPVVVSRRARVEAQTLFQACRDDAGVHKAKGYCTVRY